MAEAKADSTRYARWFRASTPYIRKHRGGTFVVMLGGDAIAHANLVNIVHDLALLSVLGVRIVMVHGARPQIEQELTARGISNTYVGHRRVTDGAAMEVIRGSVGTVRSAIEGWFSTGIPNSPLHNTAIRVLSGNLVTARPLGIIDGTDLQHTGRVRRIDSAGITRLLDEEAIVLISPLGYSPSGQAFNLSADELATDVACEIGADKLIMFDRCGRLCATTTALTPSGTDALLAGDLDDTTRRRGSELVRAVRAGVPRAHLVAFGDDGALLEELFTARGSGTQISEQEFHDIRPATIEDVAGIAELIRPLEEDGALILRPRERLEQDIGQFRVAEIDGIIVGCCAVNPAPDGSMAEIACLATHPAHRNHDRGSIGERLLAHVEAEVSSAGIDRLFALTTQARDWFVERGFEDAAVDELPTEYGYDIQRGSLVVTKRLNKGVSHDG